MKKPKKQPKIAEEWDLKEGMGIIPMDISLTQNIGCVPNKKTKPDSPTQVPTVKK